VGGLGILPENVEVEKNRRKRVVSNKFEVLKSWVMQCGVKELRRQKVVEKKPWCFRCGNEGHKK